MFKQHIYYPRIYGFKKFIPLNYMPYNKDKAKKIIVEELGWRDYGVKHGESKWTKFFQSHFLTTKCGFDKRRAHLSSLVLAKEINREQALNELEKEVYTSKREIDDDKEYIVKKLGIAMEDLDQYISGKCIHYNEYPNAEKLLTNLRKIKNFILMNK